MEFRFVLFALEIQIQTNVWLKKHSFAFIFYFGEAFLDYFVRKTFLRYVPLVFILLKNKLCTMLQKMLSRPEDKNWL